MPTRTPSFGTLVKLSVSGTFVTLPQLISATLPGAKPNTYEVTTLDQSSAFEGIEFTGTIKPGEAAAEFWFDSASTAIMALINLANTGVKATLKFILPNQAATTLTFTAMVEMDDLKLDLKDGVKVAFKFKIDGNPGWV